MGKDMRTFPKEISMRREYYLHRRRGGIFYVEFVRLDTGAKLSARSTGETDRIRAQVKAELWKMQGVPTGRARKPRTLEDAAGIEEFLRAVRKADLDSDDALRIVSALKGMGLIDIAAVPSSGRGAVPFLQFLEAFWDYDKSEYIRDKIAHGYRFSRSHANECRKKLKTHIGAFFAGKKLNCVTTDDLKGLSGWLAGKGLATSTINQTLLVCCTPLKWAFKEKIIPSNPALGLTKFSVTNRERGILTGDEASALFASPWRDRRAYAASLLSATTGARQGECLALRLSDIGEDTVSIAHSWSGLDGLKCPKNGHKRKAPLLASVREELLGLLEENPHDAGDPFVFYSADPERPCGGAVLLDGLKDAMSALGIDHRGRNISFHSWRHWFCSKITEIMDGEKVAKVSGHLSEGVFRKYASHIEAKNVRDVGEAAAEAFGGVLPTRSGLDSFRI
jgi:integrase